MSKIQPEVIKEIAREIAAGNTCYIHRHSRAVTIIDSSIEDEELISAQEETQAEMERKIKSYIRVDRLSTEEQLIIRKDFLEELPDKSVRKQLANALNRKNPVRNFNQVIESDRELSQHWRNFNFEEYQRGVSNFIIDAYKYAK